MGIAQNPKDAVVRVKYVGPGNIARSVKGAGLDFSLVLIRELSVDAVFRVDVVVDANSPLVGSGGCTRRGVEVESAARILRRRPVVSSGKFVGQSIDRPTPDVGMIFPE